MNCCRVYLRDVTGSKGGEYIAQREVGHSLPNENMPTASYDIPINYNVVKVVTVVGYGNTDTYVYVEEHKEEPIPIAKSTVSKVIGAN